MRSRNIKPGFFTNEDLAKVPPLGRILFAGLWCLADRRGRLEYRPDRIKAEVLPYDKAKVVDLLHSLEKFQFVEFYRVDDKPYIQIINFEYHQHPHVHEQESTIQAPDKHRTNTSLARLVSDSLIPDSGFPVSESSASPPLANLAPDFDFDLLWRRYPKKIGKPEAIRHFNSTVKTLPDWQAVNRALDNYLTYLKTESTDRKFIKHGSTWFNQWRGWSEGSTHGSDDSKGTTDYAALARAKRETEKTRENSPSGALSNGVRTLQGVQAKSESGQ